MAIDPSVYIAPTARVSRECSIGQGSHIGEFCVVENDVVMGRESVLQPHVYVKRWTTMGDRNELSAGVVLGTDPLDKAFQGHRSYLVLGSDNSIREHFTISRGTKPESVTRIGNGNFIMTSGHIAHDCVVGNNVVVASCALVAGHAQIEDEAFISGGVVIHQYSRVGRLAMIGGNTRVNSDVPPFFLYTDFHVAARGLNLVGLKRAGFSQEEISTLKAAYRLLYRSGLSLEVAVQRLESDFYSPHVRHLAEFIKSSTRGICRESRKTARIKALNETLDTAG